MALPKFGDYFFLLHESSKELSFGHTHTHTRNYMNTIRPVLKEWEADDRRKGLSSRFDLMANYIDGIGRVLKIKILEKRSNCVLSTEFLESA